MGFQDTSTKSFWLSSAILVLLKNKKQIKSILSLKPNFSLDIHILNREKVGKQREIDGLDIKNLRAFNLALLGKWR